MDETEEHGGVGAGGRRVGASGGRRARRAPHVRYAQEVLHGVALLSRDPPELEHAVAVFQRRQLLGFVKQIAHLLAVNFVHTHVDAQVPAGLELVLIR